MKNKNNMRTMIRNIIKDNFIPIMGIIACVIVIFYACVTYIASGVEEDKTSARETSTVEVVTTTVVTETIVATSTTSLPISTTTTSTTTTETTTTEVSTTEDINETTEETTVYIEENTEPAYEYLFYAESMRVHKRNCIYADTSCMEIIYGDYIEEARPCETCNPDITIGNLYVPETTSYSETSSSSGLTRNWTVTEMTYYSGSYGCIGASGRTLVNNYSVGCNSIPLGTIIYIESSDGSVDGYYRVDDTGGMGSNVIDIFYSDYSNTPYSFRQAGRVSCTVYIVD
jgi:hypothetical protein